jgi:hypothetical protein
MHGPRPLVGESGGATTPPDPVPAAVPSSPPPPDSRERGGREGERQLGQAADGAGARGDELWRGVGLRAGRPPEGRGSAAVVPS